MLQRLQLTYCANCQDRANKCPNKSVVKGEPATERTTNIDMDILADMSKQSFAAYLEVKYESLPY